MAVEIARPNRPFLAPGRRFACLRQAVVVLGFVSLYGCAMGGASIDSAVPDASMITGSVQKGQATPADTGTLSDQSTIKSVVSALNFTQWGKKPVPWANPDTGSQGTITTIAETKDKNQLCRAFETSREAFDGVSIYRGETCMQNGGQWTLTSFAPI